MSDQLLVFLHGAITLGFFLIAVKFLKFWRSSRDRFFLWFASAFLIFCVGWSLPAFDIGATDHAHYVFVPRLVGFLLIIAAIMDKNRSRG